MDETTPAPRPYTVRILPWILGVAFLVLYLATLNPWVTPTNVMLVGQILGWESDPPYSEPLMYLLGWLVRAFPVERAAWALNLLAAVMGALTVAILARCVALLPHDRTREQRIRGHAENTLLHGWFAPLPVILAAGLLGLQLTFWENATLQTGEMLDLLMLAFCVLTLLEYRLDLREGWLWAASFAWGMGITANWAMIGFAPLFLTAIIWIRGLSFFNAAFLTRMILWGLGGLGFYLLVPVLGSLTHDSHLGFWDALKANLVYQKTYLFGIPRGRPLLLGLVAVLPLGLVGIRWEGSKGTTVERYASFGGIVLLQVLWLAAVVYIAFDPPFSARRLLYLDESSGGLPLLTYGFLGALGVGYFSGWFLLVGLSAPIKTWDVPNPLFALLGRIAGVVTVAGSVVVPAALLVRNFPVVRLGNSDQIRVLSESLVAPLPQSPSLVLSDHPILGRLADAALKSKGTGAAHVIFETRRGPEARYRQWIASKNANILPQLAPLGSVTENVAGVTTEIVGALGAAGRAYYLHPSFGFFFEQVQAQPSGVILKLSPQPQDMVPQVATAESLASALSAWNALQPALANVEAAQSAGTKDGKMLGTVWSRTANALGVDFQRAGRLDEANRLFGQALRLNPDNQAAVVNTAVNASLRSGKPLASDLNKPVANSVALQVLNNDGPIDEPVTLRGYGQALLNATDRLPRQAWDSFYRSEELAPGVASARFGQVEALLQAGKFAAARKAMDRLATSDEAKKPTLEFSAGLQRLEIYYALTQGDVATVEKRIENARVQFATDTSLLDLLTELYIRQGRFNEAAPLLEQWRKLRPEEAPATLRLAAIHITRSQFDQSIRLLDQLLARQPDNPAARLNRAVSLLGLNRLEEAKREYMAIEEKIPDVPMVQYGLAEVALRRSNTNEAIQRFEQYLKVAPTNTLEYSNVVVRVSGLRGPRR